MVNMSFSEKSSQVSNMCMRSVPMEVIAVMFTKSFQLEIVANSLKEMNGQFLI